jgi:hypothetical protein
MSLGFCHDCDERIAVTNEPDGVNRCLQCALAVPPAVTPAQAELLRRPDVTVEELVDAGMLVLDVSAFSWAQEVDDSANPPLKPQELDEFERALRTPTCEFGCPCGDGDEKRVQFVDGSWGFYDESYDFRGGYADRDTARAGMREYALWLEGVSSPPPQEPPAEPYVCGCLLPFCPNCYGF